MRAPDLDDGRARYCAELTQAGLCQECAREIIEGAIALDAGRTAEGIAHASRICSRCEHLMFPPVALHEIEAAFQELRRRGGAMADSVTLLAAFIEGYRPSMVN